MSEANENSTVLLLGGTGFVGTHLGIKLVRQGYRVRVLTRDASKYQGQMAFPCELQEFAPNGSIASSSLDGVGAIVNLAGAGIAEKRWTDKRKKLILDSRTGTCEKLAKSLEESGKKIPVIVQASAIGFYGDRSKTELTESEQVGDGFLSATCFAWEKAGQELEKFAGRFCTLRIGLVLQHGGGVLEKLDQVYSRGAGAVLGNGEQGVSFIHMDDLVRQILFLITHNEASGVFCGTSENPVPFKKFHQTLAKVKKVAAPLFAPSVGIRVLMGEMADLVLQSQYIKPTKWKELGFEFKYPTIESALESLYADLVEPGAERLVQFQWFPLSTEQIWPFFTDEKNLETITPDLLGFKVMGKDTPEIAQGTHIDYKLSLRGIPMKWRTLIEKWEPNVEFIDRQLKGPYSLWHHLHTFEKLGEGTLMRDIVQYKLPMGLLGAACGGFFVRNDVESIFDYRLKTVPKLLEEMHPQ